jgi:hypothetical protein
MRICISVAFLLAVVTTWGCGVGYPTNVQASVSGDTITITWDEVSGASYYDVCRKMEGYFGSSGSCSELSPCHECLEPRCAYTESATPAGETTIYTFRVRAEDGQWGEWSNPLEH